ncbi:MAG: hypothetical protein EP310_07615 [Bacteroidetes bacterium]|nr:MAG: hypothetical protein EP310_07615 [Bacteroidota bacterium]
MLRFVNILYLLICFAFLQSCNTLYNTQTVKLEILVPGKVKMPADYKKAAIRYNNSNVSINPNFSFYFEDGNKINDTVNTDSIASKVYFESFAEHIKNQQFFDTIIEIEPFDYSNTRLSNLRVRLLNTGDSVNNATTLTINPEIQNLTKLISSFSYPDDDKPTIKFIDPDFGLYSREEIRQIADSTGADLLLSFDWFAAVDGIYSPKYLKQNYSRNAREMVKIVVCWNFYDLNKKEFIFSRLKMDTVSWIGPAYNLREALKVLPNRLEAVYVAADIAGLEFAEFLVPHWIEVDRNYYKSGHGELKKTDDLIKQNRWMEAAEIWKKHTAHKNKSIAALSMFNLALACEMSGEMDAALDWVIKSFYVFQNSNEFHSENCKEYIRILGQRKLDIKNIESYPELDINKTGVEY